MSGLRERKKAATRRAIHDEGLRLFAERGFAGTTIDEIAEAAGVSRATVFAYYASKEEIVFGDAALAIDALATRLRTQDESTVAAVRDWLKELTGWLEPELLLQRRLRSEAPAVAARQLQIVGAIEGVIAGALAEELGAEWDLPARLTAAALMAGLTAIEDQAAARLAEEGRGLTAAEIDHILDVTLAYVDAGLAAATE